MFGLISEVEQCQGGGRLPEGVKIKSNVAY